MILDLDKSVEKYPMICISIFRIKAPADRWCFCECGRLVMKEESSKPLIYSIPCLAGRKHRALLGLSDGVSFPGAINRMGDEGMHDRIVGLNPNWRAAAMSKCTGDAKRLRDFCDSVRLCGSLVE
jgi:hypothetical protein